MLDFPDALALVLTPGHSGNYYQLLTYFYIFLHILWNAQNRNITRAEPRQHWHEITGTALPQKASHVHFRLQKATDGSKNAEPKWERIRHSSGTLLPLPDSCGSSRCSYKIKFIEQYAVVSANS